MERFSDYFESDYSCSNCYGDDFLHLLQDGQSYEGTRHNDEQAIETATDSILPGPKFTGERKSDK